MKPLIKKGFIIFSLLLALLFFVFPAPASAQWERIVAALTAIPTLFLTTAMAGIILISGWGVMLMSAILEWVISPDFVSLSYTKPCLEANHYQPVPGINSITGLTDTCNPIIGVGLGITQQFANLLLVGLLVYIALSIALRIGDYDAKKMFTRLIVIALLVNFAPLLVGVIVDAANILMNYFLTPLRGGFSPIASQTSIFWGDVVKNLTKVFSDLPGQMGLLGQASAIIFLNISIIIILFLFAGLFICRYIVIWVIVILAPIAFIFWILPGTKKFWDMWWNNLVQWSIIGIPIAFFLYLGVSSLATFSQYIHLPTVQTSGSGLDTATTGLFNEMLPYFVVIAFLGIGFMVGLAGSAMGASAVMGQTKNFGRWMGKTGAWAGRKAGQRAITGIDRATGGKASATLARLASARMENPFAKGAGGERWKRTMGIATWGLSRGAGAVGLQLQKGDRSAVAREEGKLKDASVEGLASAMTSPGMDPQRRIAATKLMIEKNKIDEVKKILGPTFEETVAKIGKGAKSIDPDLFKNIHNAFPHLAAKMGALTSEEIKKILLRPGGPIAPTADVMEKEIIMKIVAKIKPEFVPQMDKDAFEKDGKPNEAVLESIVRNWTGAQFGKLKKEQQDIVLEELKKSEKKKPGSFEAINPRLHLFLKNSPGAQDLGIKWK